MGAFARNWNDRTVARAYADATVWPGPSCTAVPDLASNAIVSEVTTPAALQAQARVLWLRGDCTEAIGLWREAADRTAGTPSLAAFELGRALFNQTDDAGAIAAMKRSGYSSYLVAIAADQLVVGNTAAAQQLYELVLKVEPLPDAAGALANIYEAQNQLSLAVETWQQVAAETGQSEAQHWLALGEAARLQTHWDDARLAFEHAIALAPDPFDLYLRLGRLMLEAKNWDEVIAASRQAIDLKPKASSEPYTLAARAELARGNFDAALIWCRMAAEATPDDPWPNIVAAEVEEQSGALAAAEQDYRIAIQKSPHHFGAYWGLAWLKYRQGDVSAAIGDLEEIAPTGDCGVLKALIQWYAEIHVPVRSATYAGQYAAHCG